jgi:hypothetical protein
LSIRGLSPIDVNITRDKNNKIGIKTSPGIIAFFMGEKNAALKGKYEFDDY